MNEIVREHAKEANVAIDKLKAMRDAILLCSGRYLKSSHFALCIYEQSE